MYLTVTDKSRDMAGIVLAKYDKNPYSPQHKERKMSGLSGFEGFPKEKNSKTYIK